MYRRIAGCAPVVPAGQPVKAPPTQLPGAALQRERGGLKAAPLIALLRLEPGRLAPTRSVVLRVGARLGRVHRVGRLTGAAVGERGPHLPRLGRVAALALDVVAALDGGGEVVQRKRRGVDVRHRELLGEAGDA